MNKKKNYSKKFRKQLPEELYPYYDVLKEYIEEETLNVFDIIHLYPSGELCYPNGYYDSQWFELIGYNTETMEFSNLGKHKDGLNFNMLATYGIPIIQRISIYLDGSTLIKFKTPIRISNFQAPSIFEA